MINPLKSLVFVVNGACFLRPVTVIGVRYLADNGSWGGFVTSFKKGAFSCQNFQESRKNALFGRRSLPKF
jgi:hypothetical protein